MAGIRRQRMPNMRRCTRRQTVRNGRMEFGKLLAEGISRHERTLTAEAEHVRHEQRYKASAEQRSLGYCE